MTTQILRHPETEREPIKVNVVPTDIDDDRALALLQRYVDAIETGQHPPYWYVAALFSEVYERVQARRARDSIAADRAR